MSRKTPARTPKHAKRSDLAQKLLHQFRLQSTTRPGERIGVAVSGGADSVAIIAASSKVDMPLVMAMQIARLLLVILIGPSLARIIARWTAGS